MKNDSAYETFQTIIYDIKQNCNGCLDEAVYKTISTLSEELVDSIYESKELNDIKTDLLRQTAFCEGLKDFSFETKVSVLISACYNIYENEDNFRHSECAA
jgi:hypothetical protein